MRGEPRWQAFVDPKFGTDNLVSSLFVILIIASVAVLGYNVLVSWIRGTRAAVNEWGGRTLEWMLPSPVPLVNFGRPPVVLAGPYDYGMGGPRIMGAPAIAGAAVDTAAFAAPHPPDAASRADRTRYGAGLLILSWTMFGLAIFLAYIYLDGLNTMHQFKPSSERTPTTVGTVLLTVAALAGAAAWSWGYRQSRSGESARARTGVTLSWGITAAGLVGSLLVFASLKAPLPLHAYASSMSLFVLFHAWHLVVGLVIGALVLGRLYRGRIGGREYVIQVAGWWLWYTAVLAVVTMVLVLALS
jgi:heme/copper-type cytochrome/quinol oxidase subunit 3